MRWPACPRSVLEPAATAHERPSAGARRAQLHTGPGRARTLGLRRAVCVVSRTEPRRWSVRSVADGPRVPHEVGPAVGRAALRLHSDAHAAEPTRIARRPALHRAHGVHPPPERLARRIARAPHGRRIAQDDACPAVAAPDGRRRHARSLAAACASASESTRHDHAGHRRDADAAS